MTTTDKRPMVKGWCGHCRGSGTLMYDKTCGKCHGSGEMETHVRKLTPRMLGVLHVLEAEDKAMPAGSIAMHMGVQHSEYGGFGNHGTGNVARRMSEATLITPGITALRTRGLIHHAARLDGLSGSADVITAAGREALALARAAGIDTRPEDRR